MACWPVRLQDLLGKCGNGVLGPINITAWRTDTGTFSYLDGIEVVGCVVRRDYVSMSAIGWFPMLVIGVNGCGVMSTPKLFGPHALGNRPDGWRGCRIYWAECGYDVFGPININCISNLIQLMSLQYSSFQCWCGIDLDGNNFLDRWSGENSHYVYNIVYLILYVECKLN